MGVNCTLRVWSTTKRYRLLSLLLALTLISSLQANTSQKKIAPDPLNSDSLNFGPHESLRNLKQSSVRSKEFFLYDINWGLVNAGQASLETLPSLGSLWELRSRAWCNSFFQTFYPVQDTIFSIIDSLGIYPLRFEKRLHEGNYHAHEKARFNQGLKKAWVADTSFSIEPFTHDILSAFAYIRTQKIEVGKTFSLAAISGKKKYELKVDCLRRETIQVPAGTFKTLVLEPKVKGVGLFRAKGKLTIWLSDDSRKIPVLMKSKIPVGSISAELVKFNYPGN